MTVTLDDLDYEILRILAKSCNKSAREIAKELGKSPTTIVLRLRKLRHLGIIRSCKAEIDHSKLGYEIAIILQLNVDLEKLDKVAQLLAQLPYVRQVFFTLGSYNLFAVALFKSLEELSSFMLHVLSRPGIREISLSIIAKRIKDEPNIEF